MGSPALHGLTTMGSKFSQNQVTSGDNPGVGLGGVPVFAVPDDEGGDEGSGTAGISELRVSRQDGRVGRTADGGPGGG